MLELVVKAYEAVPSTERRLEVPYVEILGRRAVPPTEFVKKFRAELGRANAELEFVYFLDGREGQRAAVVASAEDLAATCEPTEVGHHSALSCRFSHRLDSRALWRSRYEAPRINATPTALRLPQCKRSVGAHRQHHLRAEPEQRHEPAD